MSSKPSISVYEYRLQLSNLVKNSAPTVIDVQQRDSSLKKITSFVKRLKQINLTTHEKICEEFSAINLTMHLSEVVQSITENVPKNFAEIFSVASVVVEASRNYPELKNSFCSELLRQIQDTLAEENRSIDETISSLKWRIRLLIELHFVAFWKVERKTLEILKNIFSPHDPLASKYLPLASYLLKGASSLLGIPVNEVVKDEFSKIDCYDLFAEFYKNLTRLLVRLHQRYKTIERRDRFHYETRGDLSEKQTETLAGALENFVKMKESLQPLSNILNIPLPELKNESDVEATFVEGKIVFASNLAGETQEGFLFETDEERRFYENLIALNLTSTIDASGEQPTEKLTEEIVEFSVKEIDPDEVVEGPKITDAGLLVIQELKNVADQAGADRLVAEFYEKRTKGNDKQAARMILEIARERSELIPLLSRFLAVVKTAVPVIATEVIETLEGQFHFLTKRKEPILRTRSRVCRFIGELTKFKVFPQTLAFLALKKCLDDFTGPNIDMFCMILELCGRFLSFQPESSKRIENLLRLVEQKRNSLHDINVERRNMITNALYAVKPLKPFEKRQIIRPDFEIFIDYVFYEFLDKKTVEPVLKAVRSLDWSNAAVREYLRETFASPWKVEFKDISCLASILSGLKKHRETFSIETVDCLIEFILSEVERGSLGRQQQLVSSVKYLGEFFVFSLVEAPTVFSILYFLATFGHNVLPSLKSPSLIDLPSDHSRIRLICVLLEVVSPYFKEYPYSIQTESFLDIFNFYIRTKIDLNDELIDLIGRTLKLFGKSYVTQSAKEAFNLLKLKVVKFSQLDSTDYILDGEQTQFDDEHEISCSAQGTNQIRIQEDEFDAEFTKLVASGLESRKLERRPQMFDEALPNSSISGDVDTSQLKILLKKRKKPVMKVVGSIEEGNDTVRGTSVGQKEAASSVAPVSKKTVKKYALQSLSSNDYRSFINEN